MKFLQQAVNEEQRTFFQFHIYIHGVTYCHSNVDSYYTEIDFIHNKFCYPPRVISNWTA